jgi:hypothetical protein
MQLQAALALLIASLAACRGALVSADGGEPRPEAGQDTASAVPPVLQAELDAAAVTWATSKPSCAIYSYARTWSSVFGASGATSIEMRNDVATRRRYVTNASRVQPDAGTGATVVFDEIGSDVGANGNGGGAYPAATVEQLLAECAALLAKDPVMNRLRLTVERHGVPTECTFTPVGCFDDCTSGISISGFACDALSVDGGAD